MQFAVIQQFIDALPYSDDMHKISMEPQRGQVMYNHIRQQRPLAVLELGVGFGVSTCYIAAALEENGIGHLTGVDLRDVPYAPWAENLLNQAGLASYATIEREVTSYTWYLKKLIEQRTPPGGVCEPFLDFCFIDGPKNWTIDGAAFFMVDKLLNEGSWIVFDDYDFTQVAVHPEVASSGMASDEQTQAQVEAIFRLLVAQHPSFGELRIEGNRWAWAHKVHADTRTIRLTYAASFRHTAYMRLRELYEERLKRSNKS